MNAMNDLVKTRYYKLPPKHRRNDKSVFVVDGQIEILPTAGIRI